MFGGTLCNTNILIIEDYDLLIASFSHQVYEFSIRQAIITNIRTHHEHPIIHLHYDQVNSIVRSVDQVGTMVAYSIFKDRKANILDIKKKVFGKNERLTQSRIRVHENEVEIYGSTKQGVLLRYSNGIIGKILDQCLKLLYLSDEYVITSKQTNIINIIDAANIQARKIYEHTCQVTSVQVYQNNLILGDQKGKINILVGFLSTGQVQIRQKLQWHVHQVTALRINGAYLYSAGEEGVVVMWHLRENVKDFLPRIGSQINNLIVAESKIYCLLQDNTIKSIDFDNDKAVSHFKVIVNPRVLQISQQSSKLVQSNLLRVSKLQDKIYLRSVPGRIQEINLHSAINTEFNIVNRNVVSRLDNNLPTPHQITDMCFSKDGNHLAIVLEGIHCRSLKFYQYDRESLNLVSKVQNCHAGSSRVSLVSLGEDKFISYSSQDSRVKVWKLCVRRKQSILQIEQYFWCCDYEITFREMLPWHVSSEGNRIIITFDKQFIVFNVGSKIVESVFGREDQEKTVVAVHGLSDVHHSLLVFYQNRIELLRSLKHVSTILKVSHDASIKADDIVISKNGQRFGLLVRQSGISHVYVYNFNLSVSHYEIPHLDQKKLTDIFWIGQRLLALDSCLFLYDITHGKLLVSLSKQSQNPTEMQVQEQGQTEIVLDYQSVSKRYLQKYFRNDKQRVQKVNELLSVSPSISGCFSLLSQGLLI